MTSTSRASTTTTRIFRSSSSSRPPLGYPIPKLANASDATVYGVELDLTTEPIEGLRITLNAAWVESEYKDFVVSFNDVIRFPGARSTAPGSPLHHRSLGEFDYSGNTLIASPNFSATGSIEYDIPVPGEIAGRGLGTLTPRFSFSWKDEMLYDACGGRGNRCNFERGFFGQDDFWIFNAALTWTSENEMLAVTGWVHNFLDEHYKTQSFDLSRGLGIILDAYADPRTYGVTAKSRLLRIRGTATGSREETRCQQFCSTERIVCAQPAGESAVALWAATAVAAFGIGWITPPPHRPPAPDDMVASLRSALGEGDVIERQRRTASLLERLDLDPLPEVAALYERMTPLIDSSELAAFFAAWARFDTLGALDHALSWRLTAIRGSSGRSRFERRSRSGRSATPRRRGWRPNRSAPIIPAVSGALRHALVTGWVHSPGGQEGLASFLADLPPLQTRVELIETAVPGTRARGRSGGRAGLGGASLARRGLRAGIQALGLQGRGRRGGAVGSRAHRRVGRWSIRGQITPQKAWASWPSTGADEDGEAALAWLGEQPAGELRDQAVREAFGQWLESGSAGARLAWLGAEKPAALHDPALESKAQRIADYEPERALGFCERIGDSARRHGCLESTAKSWYAQDAVAAETWLQQSSLDDETRSRVRAAHQAEGAAASGPAGPAGPAPAPPALVARWPSAKASTLR